MMYGGKFPTFECPRPDLRTIHTCGAWESGLIETSPAEVVCPVCSSASGLADEQTGHAYVGSTCINVSRSVGDGSAFRCPVRPASALEHGAA